MSARVTRTLARRPLRALLGLALLLSALAPTRDASSAALDLPGARVDPALAEALSTGGAAAIFTWSETTPREAVEDHLADSGLTHRLFDAFRAGVACIAPGQLSALRRTPGVPALYADRAVVRTVLAESVPEAFNGDPGFWWEQEGITGKGIGLAVMDTGVDGNHPDLEYGRRLTRNTVMLHSHREYKGPNGADEWPCSDLEYPPRDGDPVTGERMPDPVDSDTESGHGTHIASVAAGDGTASGGALKGMAPEADLWGYRVIGSASPTHDVEVLGEEYRPSIVRVLAAMDHLIIVGFATGYRAKVVLLGFTMDGLLESTHPFVAMIDGLDALGVSLVAPVGNDARRPSSCDAAETCHISYYSGHPWVIAVGASEGRTTLAPYSSVGDPVDRSGDLWFTPATPPYRPTLVAPGTRVVAAQRLGLAPFATIAGEHTLAGEGDGAKTRRAGYQSLSGTSVAAAHVAGTVALMQQASFEAKGCYLQPHQVHEILRQTATSMPGYEAHEVGAGALDATAAIWGARFAPVTAPTWDEIFCPKDL